MGKKLVVIILGAAMLCTIHDAIVENIFFKDDDGANTFCVFNPTQAFLHLRKKKLLLTRCGMRATMLIIILLRNGYFLKI